MELTSTTRLCRWRLLPRAADPQSAPPRGTVDQASEGPAFGPPFLLRGVLIDAIAHQPPQHFREAGALA
jgi:hypothetical protein